MLCAVDTNVLLDQALGNEDVLDALVALRTKKPNARFVVTPIVLEELAWQMKQEPGRKRDAAYKALTNILNWGYEPLSLIPVGFGVVEEIGWKMRNLGIIDENEKHDSELIAEAALIGCDLLLTSDSHLLEAQRNGGLHKFLQECSVEGDHLIIGSPKAIVRYLFPKR